jgi:1-phosphofructokinase family hexose kinase
MILTAGLSPAWQRLLVFDRVQLGQVNRARAQQECASGKVLNAAMAVHQLGGAVRTLAPAGGPTGESIRRALADRGLDARWIEVESPTRVCTTLLDDAGATELVGECGPLSTAELESFRRAFAEAAAGADPVVLIGSLPPGTSATLYRELIERTGARVILDARGPELLEALGRRPFMVKPNRRELAQTLGRELPDDRALAAAMGELIERGAEWAVVTQGAGPVWAASSKESWRLTPPRVAALNPIGSGDCLAGAIACALAEGAGIPDALRLGVAAAADKAARRLPWELDAARVRELAGAVKLQKA